MKLKIRTASHASPWLVLALFGVLALAGFLAVWGCESRESGVLDIQATGIRSSAGKGQGGKLFDPTDAMKEAIQDEYHAQYTYSRVLLDLGPETGPFENFVDAEVHHVAAISELFITREGDAPESIWTLDNVPTFPTRVEACVGGVFAENENIAMYDRLLDLDLPPDVSEVFVNLRAASYFHHHPAFSACATVVHQPSEYLTMAIQHEYKLHAMYGKVLADLGEIDPFINIETAEAQHVSELATLIENKGGDVPDSEWEDTDVPTFSGKGEACTMALAEEIVNRAMYDGFLQELGLAPDVRAVFQRLRAATDGSHIPVLTECAL